jgi:hypothetical protein
MIISKEFKERLIAEGIEPSNIVNFATVNDKHKKTVITRITLIDGTVHELVDNHIWYAARKNKRW